MARIVRPTKASKPCVKCGAVDRYKRGDCRPCTLVTQRKRRLANPEKHNLNKREIRKRDLPRARKRDADWITRNLEKHMLIRSRRTAKMRGWSFDLELSDIVVPETCPLLGYKLERSTDGSRRKSPCTPSLDRIDSTKGYIKGNVWVISWRANQLKSDATLQELVSIADWASKIKLAATLARSRQIEEYFRKHFGPGTSWHRVSEPGDGWLRLSDMCLSGDPEEEEEDLCLEDN